MTAGWGEFAAAEPEMAGFGADRLTALPAYLATVRRSGAPRVHPVTPIVTTGGLYLFMEPGSPKGRDLRERGWFALHSGVPDNAGTGGEFIVSGRGVVIDDPAIRAEAAAAASYEVVDHYVLFELFPTEAHCKAYGDVPLPPTTRWQTTR